MAVQHTESQLRYATAAVGQELYNQALTGGVFDDVPTVDQYVRLRFSGQQDRHSSILKAERYAIGAAISNLIMHNAVRNDGESAELIDYTAATGDNQGRDPYFRYSGNLVLTLAAA